MLVVGSDCWSDRRQLPPRLSEAKGPPGRHLRSRVAPACALLPLCRGCCSSSTSSSRTLPTRMLLRPHCSAGRTTSTVPSAPRSRRTSARAASSRCSPTPASSATTSPLEVATLSMPCSRIRLRPCSPPPFGPSGRPRRAGAAANRAPTLPTSCAPATTARAAAPAAPATVAGCARLRGGSRLLAAIEPIHARPTTRSGLLEEQPPRRIPNLGPSLAADRPSRRQRRLRARRAGGKARRAAAAGCADAGWDNAIIAPATPTSAASQPPVELPEAALEAQPLQRRRAPRSRPPAPVRRARTFAATDQSLSAACVAAARGPTARINAGGDGLVQRACPQHVGDQYVAANRPPRCAESATPALAMSRSTLSTRHVA